ncbi:unnamed protein product, partial [Vitis vinifera]
MIRKGRICFHAHLVNHKNEVTFRNQSKQGIERLAIQPK